MEKILFYISGNFDLENYNKESDFLTYFIRLLKNLLLDFFTFYLLLFYISYYPKLFFYKSIKENQIIKINFVYFLIIFLVFINLINCFLFYINKKYKKEILQFINHCLKPKYRIIGSIIFIIFNCPLKEWGYFYYESGLFFSIFYLGLTLLVLISKKESYRNYNFHIFESLQEAEQNRQKIHNKKYTTKFGKQYGKTKYFILGIFFVFIVILKIELFIFIILIPTICIFLSFLEIYAKKQYFLIEKRKNSY